MRAGAGSERMRILNSIVAIHKQVFLPSNAFYLSYCKLKSVNILDQGCPPYFAKN
jgi:hypothetical protein